MKEVDKRLLIDVRSPTEFAQGHIPRAVNIPIFSDAERHEVGLTYKQKGKEKAISLGLELVSPKFDSFIEKLRQVNPTKEEVTVYCWRGGMRSASMCWLFNQNNIQSKTIVGGYKSWRRHIRKVFSDPRKLMILSGYTGCSKTEILHALHSQGEQVIDLEGMANHRGSAFGTIGEQPSTEHFENVLAEELLTMNPNRLIWLEDESKSIGRVHLPDELKAKMNDAPMVVIEKDFNQRVKHLCTQYGVESVNDLIAGFERISRKMGGQHAKAAIGALKEKDLERACGLALKYYDRTYAHALKRSGRKPLASIDITGASHAEAADKLIQWKNQNLPN